MATGHLMNNKTDSLACLPVILPTHQPVYLSACLLISLPTCLLAYSPACLPVFQPTHQPAYLSACLLISLSTCLPAYSPACLPAYLSVCLPVFQPTHQPVCLPTHQPVYLSSFLLTSLPNLVLYLRNGLLDLVLYLSSDGVEGSLASLDLGFNVSLQQQTHLAELVLHLGQLEDEGG